MKGSSEYRPLLQGFAAAILLVCLLVILAYRTFNQFEATAKQQIEITEAAEQIRYYDEVLTMSARIGAFTSSPIWQARYDAHVPLLDSAIARGQMALEGAVDPLNQVSEENDRLIEMEMRAFELAEKGQSEEAIALLFSPQYFESKSVYGQGLQEFIKAIETRRRDVAISFKIQLWLTATIAVAIMGLLGYIAYRMYNVLARRLDLEAALSTVAKRLVTPEQENLNQEIQWVLELLAKKSRADHVWLIQRHAPSVQRLIRTWHHSGDKTDDVTMNAMLTALQFAAVDTNGNIAINPAHKDQARIGDFIGVSIQRENDHEFMICLISDEYKVLDWTETDRNVLLNLDEIIVRAIESQHREMQLKRLATTDEMTGLFNRRQFDIFLREEWNRCKGTSTTSALLILDLDHFKQVNDNYGHSIGDQVLKGIAKRLLDQIRDDDIACRVGGEEFAIILPTSDIENSLRTAERIRTFIGNTPISTEAGDIDITVSIGVTTMLKTDQGPDDVYKRSDNALYFSKENGRNQCSTE